MADKIKVKNKANGGEREFTKTHWSRLPKAMQEEWEVIDAFTAAQPTYTPPELQEETKTTVVADATVTPVAADEEETVEQKVVRLKTANPDATNAEIGKLFEPKLHHTKVAAIFKAAGM